MTAKTITRKCTRCQDANGNPTGRVLGGECFLCQGNGEVTREVVSAEAKAAGKNRAAAITALRAAGITRQASAARQHLEEVAPERHARLVASVLAGRVDAVLAALAAYAAQEEL